MSEKAEQMDIDEKLETKNPEGEMDVDHEEKKQDQQQDKQDAGEQVNEQQIGNEKVDDQLDIDKKVESGLSTGKKNEDQSATYKKLQDQLEDDIDVAEKLGDQLEDDIDISEKQVALSEIQTDISEKTESKSEDSKKSNKLSELESCVAFGLHPDKLCAAEYNHFRNDAKIYLEIRNKLLTLWYNNPNYYLSALQCVQQLSKYDKKLVWFTFFFLQDQGIINWGFVRNPQLNNFCKDEESLVEQRVVNILRTADLYSVTDKQIRRQVEAELNLQKNVYKDQVREITLQMVDYWSGFKNGQEQQQMRKLSVVVVGGGPAGMCAAQHLHNSGLQVTVVEGRERVGGRVYSYQGDFSSKVDLGASLITGTVPDTEKLNRIDPSTILCSQLGIQLHVLNDEKLPMYNATTGTAISKQMDEQAMAVLNDILDQTQQLRPEDVKNQSLWQFVEHKISQQKANVNANVKIEDEKEDLPVKKRITKDGGSFEFSEESERVLQWHIANLEYGFSAALDRVSVTQWNADEKVNGGFGGRHCMVIGGYASIFDHMSHHLNIHLNTPVKRIDWKGSEKIAVISEDGKEFIADYVVVAVPLGVLKTNKKKSANTNEQKSVKDESMDVKEEIKDSSDSKKDGDDNSNQENINASTDSKSENNDDKNESDRKNLQESGNNLNNNLIQEINYATQALEFQPQLPKWKQDAIENLGFGNLNKMVLEFESVFWDEDVDFIGMANQGGIEFRGKFFMFWNLSRFTKKPILSSLIAGKSAFLTENVDNHEQLKEECIQVLKNVYGGDKISSLKTWHVTDWSSEKFTGGAYTFMGVNSKGDEYKQLAAPIEDKIFFCGEHTTQAYFDTVGGAILTGLREACRIISLVRGEGSGEERVLAGQACNVSPSGQQMEEGDLEDEETSGDEEAEGKKGNKSKKRKRQKDGEKTAKKKQKNNAKKEKEVEAPAPRLNEKEQQNVANESRVLLGALHDAKQGDATSLVQFLTQTEEFLSRKTAVVVLKQSDTDCLALISNNLECLTVLNVWINDLYDLGKQGQDTLLNLLKLMAKLSPTTKNLQSSGLRQSVKEKGADHSKNKTIAHVGKTVLMQWGKVCKVDKSADYRSKILTSPLDLLSLGNEIPKPPKIPTTPKKDLVPKTPEIPPPTPKLKVQEDVKKTKIVETGPLASIQKEILAREKKIQELNEKLEKQIAEAPDSVKLPKIREFDQFNMRESKSSSKSDKNGKTKRGDKSDTKDENTNEKKSESGIGNSSKNNSNNNNSSKSKESSKSRDSSKSKEEVVEYIKEVLNPIYRSKKISKEDYKMICEKTMSKIKESLTGGVFPRGFVNDNRKSKIKGVIQKYVQKCRKSSKKEMGDD